MNTAFISVIIIFVLLLILVSILKQKAYGNETQYTAYLRNNDVNKKVGTIFIETFFSALLVKNKELLFHMVHPKLQIDTIYGRGTNSLASTNIFNRVNITPDYKIKNININSTNNTMVMTHDIILENLNEKYKSTMTLIKDHNGTWRLISWNYYK